jgi:hypothetical protein
MKGAKRREPSDHMQQLQKALDEYLAGQQSQFVFITSRALMHDQIDRAYNTLKSLGFSTLASRTLGSISLGDNPQRQGKGFDIKYIPLTEMEVVINQLRGFKAKVVLLEEAMAVHDWSIAQLAELKQVILEVNSRAEIVLQ